MPFVTEELWQNLKQRLPSEWPDSIIVAAYPEADDKAIDPDAERIMESVIEIIRSIRNARAQYKVESSRWVEAQIHSKQLVLSIIPYSETIQTLARARPVTFLDSRQEARPGENTLVMVLKESEVIIPMESMVDLEAERQRLQDEIANNQAEVARLEAKLGDRVFLTRAPAAVIDKERQKLYTLTDKLERLKQQHFKL
jgi:valyl-tRNA synthetase